MQPCGSRVPEAAPLHVPRWQRHCLCPVSRERPDQMSAVCSEDPGAVWGQRPLIVMAPELREGTVASMPDGIPVREAVSVRSMEVSGRRHGRGRTAAGRVIAGVLLTGTSGKDDHGMVTKTYTNTSKGEPGFVLYCLPLTVLRTGLRLPITYCSNQRHHWVITTRSGIVG